MKKSIVLSCIFLLIVTFVATVALAATSEGKIIILSLVNQDPDPAVAGDIVEVRVGVENIGDDAAENLILEVVPEYPFSAVTGESLVQKAGTIAAFQRDSDMKIVKFKVRVDREATAGAYELKIKEYKDGFSENAGIRTVNIDIENKESAEVIYIDQVELIPGKITPLKFTINYVGSSPLRDLTFNWENEDDIVLPVGSDNTKYIKYIDIGESADLSFDVIASANADPDLYKLDLTLTYDDPATSEQNVISTKAGVYVGGATDFDAAFSGVSSGEASFSISNIGSVSATSVTVRIPKQEGWRVRGSNSVIIGNLNEGDYTIASFTLQMAVARAQQQESDEAESTSFQRTAQMEDKSIKVDIIYTDSRGNRNTITKEVSVDPSAFLTSTSSDGTSTTASQMASFRRGRQSTTSRIWSSSKWYIIGAVLLVLLFVARGKYKKEKIKDPKYTYGKMLKSVFKKKK